MDPNDSGKDTILLSAEDSRHALSVLRLKSGAVVDLIDGQGKSFRGVVAGVKDGRVEVSLDKRSQKDLSMPVEIVLAASVIKAEHMDFLIQKSCELGVTGIWPILTERSVVKLTKEQGQSKAGRWQKIAHEACKQCGLSKTPAVETPRAYKDIFAKAGSFGLILMPTLAGKTASLHDALQIKDAKKILLLIGPEGDFTAQEIKLALSHGALPVGLGPLILRSETAALYAVSAISFYYRRAAGPAASRDSIFFK